MRRLAAFLAWLLLCHGDPCAAAPAWRVGVAKVEITPKNPVWLAGYAARSEPPAGTEQPLWAKALVIRGTADEVVLFEPAFRRYTRSSDLGEARF